MQTHGKYILQLTPGSHWGIVGATLKCVSDYGRYMNVEHSMQRAWIGTGDAMLEPIVKLCEELSAEYLYTHFANRQKFKRAADFWASDDPLLQRHTKRMADLRLIRIVEEASKLDIPILYTATAKAPLHIDERLRVESDTRAIPIMHFCRHDEGTEYRLHLRIGANTIDDLHLHHVTLLTYDPGLFVVDGVIHHIEEGFSTLLLKPFMQKASVAIPRRMENDYFRRFILRNAAKAEIVAEGFDIHDTGETPHPILVAETTVHGGHLLSLLFRYGRNDYAPDDPIPGRVSLAEVDGTFRFTRQLRDSGAERLLASTLRQHAPALTSSGHVVFPTLAEEIDWLREHAPQLRSEGFVVVQPSDHVYHIGPLSVEQSDSWHGDWLQTDVTVVVDDGRLRIPFSDLRATILNGENEYMLPGGERLLIPSEWLERYGDLLLIGIPKGKGYLRHKSQVSASPRARHGGAAQMPHDGWQGLRQLQATLRPYQQAGFEWLWRHFEAGTGCCLSDEMGLGKTIQTIALLLEYKERSRPIAKPAAGLLFTEEEMNGEGVHPPCDNGYEYHTSLVVAPASVVHNWHNELNSFAPTLRTCTYTGDPQRRRGLLHTLASHDVVLTTYRTLLNDIDDLSKTTWGIVVYDESQAFKTATSQIHQAVVRLQSMHSVALSGTPVENNLDELWSLMSVLNPQLLGDARSFRQAFALPIARQMEACRTELLRKLITPYFLKRTKGEVLTDLPDMQEETVVCPMTEEQTSAYATELSRARNAATDPSLPEGQRQAHLLAAIQRLRQLANGEGKMRVVFDLLENLRGTTHKVLIFSEYVSLLHRVGTEMERRGWTYETLTGETQHREQVIARFQDRAECQFFLISLKAGGVGINLTAADYVFLLDPWWNKAAEAQAVSRSHRIGQRRPVFVYRFISEHTIEQQVLSLQERKQSLIDSVMPFICDCKGVGSEEATSL